MKKLLFLLLPLLLIWSCGSDDGGTTQPEPTANVKIESSPSGATVTLNGVDKGVTPVVLTGVSYGTYTLILSLEDYDLLTDEIVVDSPNELFTYELLIQGGTLQITTDPTGAQIWISYGSEVFDFGLTPLDVNGFPVGEFDLDLEKTGYFDLIDSFQVAVNQTTSLDYNMTLEPVITDAFFVQEYDSQTGIYSGRGTSFSNIMRIYYLLSFSGYNQENWQVRTDWYIDDVLALTGTWSEIYSPGTVRGFVFTLLNSDNFPVGLYRAVTYLKENVIEYDLHEESFTVTAAQKISGKGKFESGITHVIK